MNQESNSQELDQKILILNGVERILNFYISRCKNCKKNIVICNDYTGPITIKKTAPIWNENLKLDARGIQFRCLTDIRNENLEYCKEMLDELKHLEIRHMDGVKGNFTIHDNGEIFIIFVDKTGEPVKDAIFSTHKGMVEAHLFTFENLWSQATPAPIRIKELERGIQPEVLQTIRDPNEILETAYNLVKSAKEEILIIFHTANALLRQEKTGGLNLLIESALKYRTRIKILVPIENEIASTVHRLRKIKDIQIRNIEHEMQTMMTILVADRMSSLVVELKDDTKDNAEQAIGLATYSNSRSTVLSYVSIFETLWRQSELREELTIRSTAQRDFIDIAAHELRNPIQPILGLTDILLLQHSDSSSNNGSSTEFKMTDQQKEMIVIIARNARRLHRLAEDILDVTKIDAKTLKLNKEKFVLSEAIEEIVVDFAMDIRNSNKNVVISFSPSLNELESTNVVVVADKNRIRQVICNLIDNAIKFTETGRITISTNIDEKHNHVIVTVEDTGIGIDSEVLPRLFTKFATKSDKGTGLGLYISKGILEAHGGRIWGINNSERIGATFGFSLPLDYV